MNQHAPPLDLAALAIFRAVAQEGSVTRAAERLQRVQSNVTTRVRQLEADVSATLFLREGKRMALTAEGELLLTSISGTPQEWSARALLNTFLRMPFLTAGVVFRIHWQAIKLWLKGVPFRGAHVAPPLQETTK